MAQSKEHFWSEDEARQTINHLITAKKLKNTKTPFGKGK
jgi:hypothetical protein